MGVLGVLSLAKSQKLISEVRPLLDRLRLELRFRIAEKLYDQFLRAIGEP
jgi:predicted nucleic acid-binding protein